MLAFWIFVSNGTVSSKLSIFSSIRFYLLLLDLVSVRSQGGWGEQYFTLEGFGTGCRHTSKIMSISISPVIYLIRLLCLQVYLFWCCATLQPFKIWFLVSCLLPCNSAPSCKHSLQRSDTDFPPCRMLVCVGRVSKQELSRNFSVPFFRLNM